MTTRLIHVMVYLLALASMAKAGPADTDPCANEDSNVDQRVCYTKQQTLVNAQADSLATRLSLDLRKDAADSSAEGDKIVADLLRKAARELARSQKSWRAYRDQQCNAVLYSYTTGSGAGTAYEACMFQLGQSRVRELRDSFGD